MKSTHSGCRFIAILSMIAVSLIAFAPLAGAQESEDTTTAVAMTSNEWTFTPIWSGSTINAVFVWRRPSIETTSHVAFLFTKSGSTWTPYIYPGGSLLSAVNRATTVLAGASSLSSDPALRGALRNQTDSDPSGTTFIVATNGLIQSLNTLGVFGGTERFPYILSGSSSSATLGTLTTGELTQCGATDPSLNRVGLAMEAAVAVLGQAPSPTSDPAPVASLLSDCWHSSKNCGVRSAWTCTAYVYDSCTPLGGGGSECWYTKSCNRTRTCRHLLTVCCWDFTWTSTETETKTVTDYCMQQTPCATCPAAPACPLQ